MSHIACSQLQSALREFDFLQEEERGRVAQPPPPPPSDPTPQPSPLVEFPQEEVQIDLSIRCPRMVCNVLPLALIMSSCKIQILLTFIEYALP